jgi:hypothetical protein
MAARRILLIFAGKGESSGWFFAAIRLVSAGNSVFYGYSFSAQYNMKKPLDRANNTIPISEPITNSLLKSIFGVA